MTKKKNIKKKKNSSLKKKELIKDIEQEIEELENTIQEEEIENKKKKSFLKKFFNKKVLYVLGIVAALAIGFGVSKIDFSFIAEHKLEKTKTQLLSEAKANTKELNSWLKQNNYEIQLDENSVEFAQDGDVGKYHFLQYVALDSSKNEYVSWVYNSENKKLLAVFVNEAHKKDSPTNGKYLIKGLANLHKDNIESEYLKQMLAIIDTDESNYFMEKDFTYYQYFVTDNIAEENDYEATYEMDFFLYTEVNNETNEE